MQKAFNIWQNILLFLIPITIGISGPSPVPIMALLFLTYCLQQEQEFTITINKKIIIFISFLAIMSILPYSVKPLSLVFRMLVLSSFGLALINYKIINKHKEFLLAISLFIIFLAFLILFLGQNIWFKGFARRIVLEVNPSLCVLTLITPIIAFFYWQKNKKKTSLGLILLNGTVVFLSHSATAKLEFFVIYSVFLISYLGKKKLINYIFILYLLGNAIALISINFIDKQKLAEKTALQYSFLHRTCIWEFTLKKSLEQPFGHGFNSSRNKEFSKGGNLCIVPNEKTHYQEKINRKISFSMSLHPHYNIAQILFELGFLGLALFISFLFSLKKHILSIKNNKERALLNSLLYGYIAISTTGYGIWQNWYLASFFIIIFIYKNVCSRKEIN